MIKLNKEDKEVIEITPIILGGNPNDVNNKKIVSRKEHIEYVKYWNAAINKIKKGKII